MVIKLLDLMVIVYLFLLLDISATLLYIMQESIVIFGALRLTKTLSIIHIALNLNLEVEKFFGEIDMMDTA